jgi:hypothetical protein
VNEIPGPIDNPDVLFEQCAGKSKGSVSGGF